MKAMAELGPGLGSPGSGPPGSVSLAVSSSLSAFSSLRRYGTELSIGELKQKLELVVGVAAPWMELELRAAGGELLARLEPDDALLGAFPVSDGCGLHVIDRSGGRMGQFEDVSQVPKYEMADSDYDKRTGLTDFKPGHWVGVRYDEPVGKHDGSVGGRRYFECPQRYGAFVRPQRVTVGDFPPEDDGLDEL